MNPADELRTAATRLRQRAADATPGPWKTDTSIPYGHRVGSTDDADWIAWTGEHGETGSEADAAYIAAMGPNVGTLLARWLDVTANSLDANTHPGWQETVAPDALAIAREINRAQP
ncbi:hypothetical protein ACIP8U_00585 [Streptomyces pseudovenezuelae]|uniref:hypothetical protein n=1 Tax=Streptomyces pseudovenezuelae TaxID=67350 RepID=UPI0037F16417